MADIPQYFFKPTWQKYQWSPCVNALSRSTTYPFAYYDTKYEDLFYIAQNGKVYTTDTMTRRCLDIMFKPDRYAAVPDGIIIPIPQRPTNHIIDNNISTWGSNTWMFKGGGIIYVNSTAAPGIIPTARYIPELKTIVGDSWFEIKANTVANVAPDDIETLIVDMEAKGAFRNFKLKEGESYVVPVEVYFEYGERRLNFFTEADKFVKDSQGVANYPAFDVRKVF